VNNAALGAGCDEQMKGGETVELQEVVLLDVTGMSCGGCSAAVKRILENQPRVAFANVNLSAETALVRCEVTVPAAADASTRQTLLATQLTTQVRLDSLPRRTAKVSDSLPDSLRDSLTQVTGTLCPYRPSS